MNEQDFDEFTYLFSRFKESFSEYAAFHAYGILDNSEKITSQGVTEFANYFLELIIQDEDLQDVDSFKQFYHRFGHKIISPHKEKKSFPVKLKEAILNIGVYQYTELPASYKQFFSEIQQTQQTQNKEKLTELYRSMNGFLQDKGYCLTLETKLASNF